MLEVLKAFPKPDTAGLRQHCSDGRIDNLGLSPSSGQAEVAGGGQMKWEFRERQFGRDVYPSVLPKDQDCASVSSVGSGDLNAEVFPQSFSRMCVAGLQS